MAEDKMQTKEREITRRETGAAGLYSVAFRDLSEGSKAEPVTLPVTGGLERAVKAANSEGILYTQHNQFHFTQVTFGPFPDVNSEEERFLTIPYAMYFNMQKPRELKPYFSLGVKFDV